MANLPYNVATPLISNLLALDRPPCTMTITVQKEVADRIVARPGVKDYGGVGHLDPEPVPRGDRSRAGRRRSSGRGPRSRRPSCKSRSTRRSGSGFPIGLFFTTSCDRCSCHRRKVLRSELLSARKQFGKAQVDELLAGLGLEPTVRAERLGPDEMLRLCEAVRSGNRLTAGRPFIKMEAELTRKEKPCTLSKCRARP